LPDPAPPLALRAWNADCERRPKTAIGRSHRPHAIARI
jgi:hypothetical protein